MSLQSKLWSAGQLSQYGTLANISGVLADYRLMEKMGEGTFSEVLKCQSMLDGKLYACKKMKHIYRR